jgi:hypothetical protein
MSLGSIQPQTEMNTRNLPRLPARSTNVTAISEPTLENVGASAYHYLHAARIALPLLTFPQSKRGDSMCIQYVFLNVDITFAEKYSRNKAKRLKKILDHFVVGNYLDMI